MSLALLFNNDETVIYLDAVTSYNKTRRSNISEHPVDSSSFITDHVSKSNPTFSIRGTISSADFNNQQLDALDDEGNIIDPDARTLVDPLTIIEQSNLTSFLPGAVQQVLGTNNQSRVESDEFRGYLHQVARDRFEQAWQDSEFITILDYDYDFQTGRSSSIRIVEDCLIENYNDIENVDTGDSLEFNITFRKVRFAYLKEVDIQINRQPSAGIADEAAGESNQGDQTGEASKRFADYVESPEGLGISDLTEFINIPGF